jgi:hypothetical protein
LWMGSQKDQLLLHCCVLERPSTRKIDLVTQVLHDLVHLQRLSNM